MADNEFALSSINQARHFDFDTAVLSNKVFNVFMVNWASVVDMLILSVVEILDDDSKPQQITALKKIWLERLFQRGKINVILDRFKKTIDQKVLMIPRTFILEDDIENSKIQTDEAQAEESLLKKIVEKRAKITQLRIKIETLIKVDDIRSINTY